MARSTSPPKFTSRPLPGQSIARRELRAGYCQERCSAARLTVIHNEPVPKHTSDQIREYVKFLTTRTRAVASPRSSVYEELLQMEGILKDVYKEIGGAERAIRELRRGYSR